MRTTAPCPGRYGYYPLQLALAKLSCGEALLFKLLAASTEAVFTQAGLDIVLARTPATDDTTFALAVR